MTVKFGLIGTGAMAALMLPAFRHTTGADLVAVSSSSLDRAKLFASLHDIENAIEGHQRLLADKTIDAVYIANATLDHAATSIAALEAGKHVLCEKPFAMTEVDGAHVIDAAKASGKLFMEGLWTHFLPAYQRVYELCRSQSASKSTPAYLTAAYGYPSSPVNRPRLFRKEDGGVLLDISVYPISLAMRLLGPVSDFTARVTRNSDGIDTHVSVQSEHKRGAAQLTASFDVLTTNAASLSWDQMLVSVPAPLFGAERVVINHHHAGANTDDDDKISQLKKILRQNPLARRLKSSLLGGEQHSYGADMYVPQMQHFVSLIADGKLESDIISHEFSLDVVRMLDRIRAAEQSIT